ncbi:hypothetical protein P3T76_014926 [Phytophthora citrophthora]|uniref:M96 mating-specific protein family n=1 Tax=Phytophthora citrophthora TaxID=4793 RepID=A0AAD9LAN5_9STRA|nr:hypothetical protein P3T76_014926 [Phytophthora citrophthora]
MKYSSSSFCLRTRFGLAGCISATEMSSFLPLGDLEPTLSDVLAFIDTFDSDTTSSSTSSSSDDGRMSPPSAPQPNVDRRKSRKAAASRRCQQKKRAELFALRAQVTALETRVQELKGDEKRSLTVNRLDNSQRLKVAQLWREKAKEQRQLRLQSEQENKQLLTVLSKQSKVAQAVQDVLCNVTAVVRIEEALRTPPPTNSPATLEGFVPNLHDAIYGELSARLGRIYVDVNAKFTRLDQILIQNVSTGVEVSRDPVSGVLYVELTAAMMTNLDLKQAEEAVWNLKACHYNKFRKYLSELGTKKETEMELRDEEKSVQLSMLSLSRKYEEENRLTMAWSSLVSDQPTGNELRFREEGFFTISKPPTSGAIIQSRYRLTPEMSLWTSTTTTDKEAAREFVLQKLGGNMWANIQTMQHNCNEARFNPASIPAAC